MSRCSALYVPQAGLAEFETVGWRSAIRRSAGWSRARVLLLLPFFSFKSVLEQGREQLIPISRRYPRSISVVERTSGPVAREIDQRSSRNVLLLGALDIAKPAEIRRIFLEIATELTKVGYTCYFKDHPNPDHRVGSLSEPVIIEIEPEIPAETLNMDFRCSIGLFSSALPRVGFAAVSIGPLWSKIEPDEVNQRSRFLRQEAQDRQILWCYSVEEVLGVVTGLED